MDDIKKAVMTCFNKYVEFKGRADRPEFWYFVLFQVVVLAVLGLVSQTLQGLGSLALFLPGLAVSVRRLHDIGKSGWWVLIGLIPLVGWVILIYWGVQPGQPAANEYGEPTGTPPSAPPEMAPGQQ
jgi:uncharacterized membrane protein YhaH (DUF805 family)